MECGLRCGRAKLNVLQLYVGVVLWLCSSFNFTKGWQYWCKLCEKFELSRVFNRVTHNYNITISKPPTSPTPPSPPKTPARYESLPRLFP